MLQIYFFGMTVSLSFVLLLQWSGMGLKVMP